MVAAEVGVAREPRVLAGRVYSKSSMFEPVPQRSTLISGITARGSTSSRSCMNVPTGSLNGPKRSGVSQPTTSSNQARASAMSGTVMPT